MKIKNRLANLKKQVCTANLQLVRDELVIQTWGNVSGIDRQNGLVVIKPSGVPYKGMKPEHMVVVELESGRPVGKGLKPSSDTPTHLELYRAFTEIGGIVHTHSVHATAWAQARRQIPPLGTTHADYFYGAIPCTRPLTRHEIAENYEAHTGKVIIECFRDRDPLAMPAVLVAGHAPFVWGPDPLHAAENAAVLEAVARMATDSLTLNPNARPLPKPLLNKHYFRKHGDQAYYGQ